jgi:hypothetical protein
MKFVKLLIAVLIVGLSFQGCVVKQPTKSQKVQLKSGQVWTGEYVCGQGRTDLVLKIIDVNGKAVNAIFDFNYRNGKAVGQFELKGTYNKYTNKVSFKPGKWLYRPSGYTTVGMEGSIIGNQYIGKIQHNSCQQFKVQLR